jgi:hypothetical protein
VLSALNLAAHGQKALVGAGFRKTHYRETARSKKPFQINALRQRSARFSTESTITAGFTNIFSAGE